MTRLALLLPLVLAGGCGMRSASDSRTNTIAFSWMLKTNLKVCWEIETQETSLFRQELQQSTVSAFQGSILSFEGWQVCTDNGTKDIRLFIYDDVKASETANYKAYVAQLVFENDGKTVGVDHPRLRFTGQLHPANLVLNRTFKNADPAIVAMMSVMTKTGAQNLSISSSIHEIGRAIGLIYSNP